MAKKSARGKLQKETSVVVQVEKSNISLLSMFILTGLFSLLFFSPFFRGLFFPPEQEKALLLALVVFILVCIEKVSKKETKVFYHPLDYFLLALPIVYIIATFNAVNYNLSINEIVKNVLYFLVYWIVVQSIKGERDRSLLLHVIYFAALGAALAGLATGIGIINIKDGISLEPKVFISSSFQYHNALAGYLGAAMFLGLYFWNEASHRSDGLMTSGKLAFLPDWLMRLNPQLLLYTKINFLILTVFLASKSRGGALFFAVVFLLYLIAIGRDRLAITIYMLLMSVSAYIAAEKFLSCMATRQMSSAVLWVIAGLLLALAGQMLFILYGKHLDKLGLTDEKNQKYIFGIMALAVIAAGLVVNHFSNVENKVLSFNYLRNALERMYFVDDALKMLKQRPLLGWGGGGWEESYRSFQEYLYNSTQVHSYYVQVAVETGIAGILTLIGIIGSFFTLVFNLYRNNKENKPKLHAIVTFSAMVLFIAGHAMMDFNLSLSSLTLLLWTLFGLLVGMWRLSLKQMEVNSGKNMPPSRGYLCIAAIIAVIVFAADSSLILSGKYSRLASESFSQKDVANGLPYMEQAANRNPFNASYKLTLAQIYRGGGQKDKALAEVKELLELSKYNPSMYIEASKIYYGLEDTETAVKLAEKAVELSPYKIDGYDNLVNLYFTVGYNGLIKQKKDVATDYFNKINSVSANIQTRVDGLTDYQRKMWKDGPMLALTTNMSSKTGAARYFLGQYKEAEDDLNFAATDEKLKAEVPLWRALVAQKLGDPVKAQEILQAGEKDNDKIRQQFAGISTLSLK